MQPDTPPETYPPQTNINPVQSVTQEPPPANPDLAPENKKSKSVFKILAVIITVLLLGLAAFLFMQNSQLKQELVQPTFEPKPYPLETPPSTPDPTAGWEMYENTFFEVSFKYPQTFALEEDSVGGGFQILLNRGETNEIAIDVSSESIGNSNLFLGTPPTGERIFGGNDWLVFSLPDGYPDSMESEPRPVYAVRASSHFYTFTFRVFGSGLIDEQEQILSTFKFLPDDCRFCPVYDLLPDFCLDGEIVNGPEDECGCLGPPECVT